MSQPWLQGFTSTSHATTALCKECNQIRLYAERQPESRFRVMKVGRDECFLPQSLQVFLLLHSHPVRDDNGNYMSRFRGERNNREEGEMAQTKLGRGRNRGEK